MHSSTRTRLLILSVALGLVAVMFAESARAQVWSWSYRVPGYRGTVVAPVPPYPYPLWGPAYAPYPGTFSAWGPWGSYRYQVGRYPAVVDQPIGQQQVQVDGNRSVSRPVYGPEIQLARAVESMRTGRYDAALADLQPVLEMEGFQAYAAQLAGLAFFAKGQYAEAAHAVRTAMSALSEDVWGREMANYLDYFPSNSAYTEYYRELEEYSKAHPDDANARFLRGYHYGFLGFTAEAVRELQKAAQLEQPQDPYTLALVERFDPQAVAAAPEEELPAPASVAPAQPAPDAFAPPEGK